MNQAELPLSWPKALLAVIPGLLAVVGLVSTNFSDLMLVGMALLFVYLLVVFFINKRQVPGWSLMAGGMLSAIGVLLAAGVIGGLSSVAVGQWASVIVVAVMLIVLIALLTFSLRKREVSPVVWTLLALIVVCQLGVRVKYFVLLGTSWSVVYGWLFISLYAVLVGLLLPVAFGLLLAPRVRQQALLFVVGAVFLGFQLLIDINNRVGGVIGGTIWFTVYKVSIPLLFTVVAPLWFLRALSARSRLGGLLGWTGLAVVIDLVLVGLSYQDLPVILWISFIPYTLSVLLTLVLGYVLYGSYADEDGADSEADTEQVEEDALDESVDGPAEDEPGEAAPPDDIDDAPEDEHDRTN